MADRLQVVSSRLLDTLVGGDGGVPGGTSEVLAILVGNVLTSLGITVTLREAEVDNVNDILLLAVANKEVVRLHVAMNEMVVMKELEALDHLIRNHKSCLDSEFTLAEVESIFETGTQQVHDHGVVVALDAKPVYAGNTSSAVENFVDIGLIQKLRKFRLNRFLYHKESQLMLYYNITLVVDLPA